jgi:branched-chain amino acid transport system substrate-binding protein
MTTINLPLEERGMRTLFLLALCALLYNTTSGRAADTFDINVILPLTGGGAFLGKAEEQALQRYELVANSNGGIQGKPLRFVFNDDQTSPQIAVQLANQIKAGKPPVVIGSALVALCNAMMPLMKEGPVLYCLSPGIYPPNGSFTFSSSVAAKDLYAALLRYFGRTGRKRLALITSTDATGQDAHKSIKALVGAEQHKDVELVAEAQFNPTDVSASAQIERLKGANPDALVAWSSGAPIGTVFKAIRDAGWDIPVATTDANMTYAQMSQYGAFLPRQLIIPSPDWLKDSNAIQSPKALAAKAVFFKAFEGTDIKPDGPSTFAWDPALLVVETLNKLPPGATANDVRKYLAELKDFAGINGDYNFTTAPNRGVDEKNVVVTRWDTNEKTWVVVSDPLGIPRRN